MSLAFVALAFVLAGCALYSLTRGMLSPHAQPGAAPSGLGGTVLAVLPPMAFLLIATLGLAARWRRPIAVVVVAAAAAAVWIAHADGSLRYVRLAYLADHAVANLTFAHWFARTLRPGMMPLCTEVARRVHRTLPPRVARYTRHVTATWASMFAAIAIVSVVVYLGEPFKTWMHFVWLSTAPLTVAVFVVEYAIRCVVIPRSERTAAIDTFRALATMRPPGMARAVSGPGSMGASGHGASRGISREVSRGVSR
jgi:uncharacterized membrane protein